MDRKSSIRKEFDNSDGPVPGPEHFPSSSGNVGEEAASTRVSSAFPWDGDLQLSRSRFMADKIMPLTQAEEGYELFDKMKVQKVIFEAQK